MVVGVSCSSPGSTRDYVIMANRRQFHFADKLAYMCRRGLVPDSSPVITCTSTGHWDKLPNCRGIEIRSSVIAGYRSVLCPRLDRCLALLSIQQVRSSFISYTQAPLTSSCSKQIYDKCTSYQKSTHQIHNKLYNKYA